MIRWLRTLFSGSAHPMSSHGATWFPNDEQRRAIESEKRFDHSIHESEQARDELRAAIGIVKTVNLESHWLERALLRQSSIHTEYNDGVNT